MINMPVIHLCGECKSYRRSIRNKWKTNGVKSIATTESTCRHCAETDKLKLEFGDNRISGRSRMMKKGASQKDSKYRLPDGWLPEDYTQGTGTQEDDAKYNFEWAINYGLELRHRSADDALDQEFYDLVTDRMKDVCEKRKVTVHDLKECPEQHFAVNEWDIE